MVTYKQAKKNALKVGWSKADKDSMMAAGAEILSYKLCLSAEVIYKWTQEHHVHIDRCVVLDSITSAPMKAVDYILADKAWEE